MPPLRRYELTDAQWKLIATTMPPKKPGGQWNDHRTYLYKPAQRHDVDPQIGIALA